MENKAKAQDLGKLHPKKQSASRGKIDNIVLASKNTHGYIRRFKRHYYQACQKAKQPDGSFKEVSEYLGTFAFIVAACRKARGNHDPQ